MNLLRRIILATQEIFVDLKDLPEVLQRALQSVGYRKPNIGVKQATSFRPNDGSSAFEGNRGYLLIVDMKSGQFKHFQGSYGGSNMFTKNTVDDDDSVNPIPPNGAVITGESGGRGHFAHILVHPSNFAALALPEGEALLPKEQKALNAIGSLTSAGRKDEFQRAGLGAYGPENPLVKRLAELGLVKIQGRNVSITTLGKNRRTRDF